MSEDCGGLRVPRTRSLMIPLDNVQRRRRTHVSKSRDEGENRRADR